MADYPEFPTGGAADRPMWFSSFDPRYMQFALDVFCDQTLLTSGGGHLYNSNAAQPPSSWVPSWPMYQNAGNFVNRTAPIVWAGTLGPRRVMWLTYAGGQVPD